MNTQTFHTSQPVAFGAAQAAGLGAAAGALEAVMHAASLKLPLSAGGFFALGVVDVLVMGVFALLVALSTGAAWFARPAAAGDPVPGWSVQAAVTVLALTGWYLGFEALARVERGDPIVVAAALAAMPLGFAGLAYYNARFWFRWVERTNRPWGFPIGAWTGSAVVVVGATIAFASRSAGGVGGTAEDRSAVLVTVDGLSPGALDGDGALASFADRPGGLAFPNAATPIPISRPANISLLTGLHPLRHGVFTDHAPVSTRFPTLFSVVAEEGWQTVGFVSSGTVGADSGLDHGLHLLDDALTPLAWLGRVDVLGRLGVGRGDAHRDAEATVGAFTSWLEGNGDRPFVAWIHLADPLHAARTGGDADAAMAAVDAAVAEVLDALEARGTDDTLVVVAGTHGLDGPVSAGLGEEVVRVPIVLDAPGEDFAVHEFDAQVRTLEVINTAAEYLELPPIDTSEGVSLLPYGREERAGALSCTLVGRDAEGDWLLGLRNNGVKYWVDRQGDETLYYLRDDPGETTDLAGQQPDVLAQARGVVTMDRAAMQRMLWR